MNYPVYCICHIYRVKLRVPPVTSSTQRLVKITNYEAPRYIILNISVTFSHFLSKYFITFLSNIMHFLSLGQGETKYVYVFMIKCFCEISLCQEGLANIPRLRTTVRPRSNYLLTTDAVQQTVDHIPWRIRPYSLDN